MHITHVQEIKEPPTPHNQAHSSRSSVTHETCATQVTMRHSRAVQVPTRCHAAPIHAFSGGEIPGIRLICLGQP